MNQVAAPVQEQTLEERVRKGADILFDMEMRGDTGPQYHQWLRGWMVLLREYEAQYREQVAA